MFTPCFDSEYYGMHWVHFACGIAAFFSRVKQCYNLRAKLILDFENPLYSGRARWYTLPKYMVKANKIRHILALVIVLATLYVAVSLALKLGVGGKKKEGLPALPRNVEISLSKIHYTETKNGIKQWDLFAEKGEYDKARDVTRLSGVRLVLHERGKRGDITLVSDQADYFNASKDVKLSGNVVAKSESGMEFTTGQAFYQSNRSVVITDDRVRFTDSGMSVTGIGMELFVKTRQVRILRDVTATVTPGKRG